MLFARLITTMPHLIVIVFVHPSRPVAFKLKSRSVIRALRKQLTPHHKLYENSLAGCAVLVCQNSQQIVMHEISNIDHKQQQQQQQRQQQLLTRPTACY